MPAATGDRAFAAVSGYLYGDDHIVRDGMEQGCIHAFVGKPFLIDEVLRALQHALAGPKA